MDSALSGVDEREVLRELEAMASPENRAGMARFGIETARALGVSVVGLRKLARRLGRDHDLAARLWATGVHEARLMACFVDEPGKVTPEQMEAWAAGFDSWDICDQCCGSLFDRTPFAVGKATEWAGRSEEFVKRAGFALMAQLAVHDKNGPDEPFESFLPLIAREAVDERNFVKKAVNWALRQIGKRNLRLNALAIETAREVRGLDSGAARWIASDALRELTSVGIQGRLRPQEGSRRG